MLLNFKKAKALKPAPKQDNTKDHEITDESSNDYYMSDIPSHDEIQEIAKHTMQRIKQQNGAHNLNKIEKVEEIHEEVDLRKLKCNHNYGQLTLGSLCFVDYDCNIKKIYKRPIFDFVVAVDRVIAVTHNKDHYFVLVVKNGILMLEAYSPNGHKLIWSSSISEDASLGNINISSSLNDLFLISKNRLLIFRNRFIFRDFLINNIADRKKLIVNDGSFAYIAATSSIDFHNIKAGHTYIAKFSTSGLISAAQLNADMINLIGMAIGDGQLFISGDFCGQLMFAGKKLGPLIDGASFIISIDISSPIDISSILWYRILVSKDCSAKTYTGIGEITYANGYVYTTYRFQQSVAISGINTDEIQLSRQIEDEGFMLIRLKDDNILWRFFPAGNQVQNGVISALKYIDSRGQTTGDVIISGFSSAPIRNNHCGITNHFFMMMFSFDLFEKSYITLNNVFESSMEDKNMQHTGNVVVADGKIVISGMYNNILYSHQFGDITPPKSKSGVNSFILVLDMKFPKLIGVLVDLENCKLLYQGKLQTTYLQVGADYYINQDGNLVLTPIDGIYYGTAISSNVLYIK